MTAWVLDLDGVLWLGDEPIAGAAEAASQLVDDGVDVALVSNNSYPTIGDYRAKLASHGVPERADLITSAMAAASLVRAGERVLVCAGPGVVEAIEGRGAEAVPADVDPGPVDAVIVGFHREFDYERLRRAATAVRGGARLLATNDDATYPTPDGPIPGGGAILAAIERAAGASATIAGKPYEPICALVRSRHGVDGIVVGDRPDTDGRFARALGWRFALVLSGVTTDPAGADPAPDLVAPDLASLVANLRRGE